MASAAIPAYGTLIKIGDGAVSETFTPIVEATNISGPHFKTEMREVTGYSSPGGWKEKAPTVIDPGQLTFDCNFVPTAVTQSQSMGLIRDQRNGTRRNFQLVYPDPNLTTWQFAAYVVGTDVKSPVDDKLTVAFVLELTKQFTETFGSPNVILLEDGTAVLLEDGTAILMES